MLRSLALLAALGLAPTASAFDMTMPGGTGTPAPRRHISMDQTIQTVEQMVWDDGAQRLASANGLSLVNVTWEDTGRYSGSAVGPNISDMTIGVRDSSGYLHPMPVFRFDNFTDKTADIRSDRFYLPVGNEKGLPLRSVSLAHALQYTASLLSKPGSWKGQDKSLWDDRDEHVLVSAQACFLPVPKAGEATFTPVIYNYQSSVGNPAVLTIVATREGTSIQVVENDEGYMSEPLYFNADGERAPFTATRMSDYLAGGATSGVSGAISAAGEDGLNTVMVIQVPLKYTTPPSRGMFGYGGMSPMEGAPSMAETRTSDTENAVIGHGEVEGPFTEINGLAIERDDRFPVRVTIQLYKATSTGQVSAADVAELRQQIDRIYADADYVGSLVTEAPSGRPTDWRGQSQTSSTWAPGTWFSAL